MITLKQGPVTRRPPTYFAAEVKDSSKYTRLVSFEFSTEQAYVLEFGHNYVRVHKDYGIVTQAPKTITGITKANPAVVTSTAHGYSNGDQVYLTVIGMTELNNRRFTVAGVAANTFQLTGINSTAYTTFVSGTVSKVFEVATTYTEAQLEVLNFRQSADVLYIAHQAHITRTLLRFADDNWTINNVTYIDGPYQVINQKSDGTFATTLSVTPSAVSGVGITLTASASLFAATDVGRLVRLKHGSTWGNAVITAFTSVTVVTATVNKNYGATGASTDWRLGAYSATTGYPSALGFFQDRFVSAAPTNFPQRVDFAQTGQYTSTTITYTPTAVDGTVADDNGFTRNIPSGSVNKVRWLSEDSRGLLVGTSASEWLITGSQIAGTLKPDDAFQREISYIGSADIQAAKINSVTIFIQDKGRKIHQIAYALANDTLESTDLVILAEHITASKVRAIAYQQESINTLWAALENGELIGMTYLPEQKIIGFHRHILGGTNAKVISLATIPAPDNSQDDLWVIVERTVNGNTVKYIEYFKPYFENSQTLALSGHVDSASFYNGVPTNRITGLWHLEGETVRLMVDGSAHPDVVVANGVITLNALYSKIVVGLKYRWEIITLPIEAGAANGTAQGKIKRIPKCIVRFLNTLGVAFGGKDEAFVDLEEDIFDYGTQMGTPTPLFNGDRIYSFDMGYDRDGQMKYSHEGVFPVTILALMPEVVTND